MTRSIRRILSRFTAIDGVNAIVVKCLASQRYRNLQHTIADRQSNFQACSFNPRTSLLAEWIRTAYGTPPSSLNDNIAGSARCHAPDLIGIGCQSAIRRTRDRVVGEPVERADTREDGNRSAGGNEGRQPDVPAAAVVRKTDLWRICFPASGSGAAGDVVSRASHDER